MAHGPASMSPYGDASVAEPPHPLEVPTHTHTRTRTHCLSAGRRASLCHCLLVWALLLLLLLTQRA
jgi:hypothetical protein